MGKGIDDNQWDLSDPESLQREITHTLGIVLQIHAKMARGSEVPLFLVLEDLHWMDESSLKVRQELFTSMQMHSPSDWSIVVITTYRDEFQVPDEIRTDRSFMEIMSLYYAKISKLYAVIIQSLFIYVA